MKTKRYEIVMTSWGGSEKQLFDDLSYDEALDICTSNNWQLDTGYIWDLEIREVLA